MWISSAVSVKDKGKSFITVLIDGEWTALDFIRVLTVFDNLYALWLPRDITFDKKNRKEFVTLLKGTDTILISDENENKSDLDKYVEDEYQKNRVTLTVNPHKIKDSITAFIREPYQKYVPEQENTGSFPAGFIQIKQIQYASPGKIEFKGIAQILEVIFNFIKYYLPNKAEKEKVKLENQALAQEVLAKSIANWQTVGFSKTQIKQLTAIQTNSVATLQKQLGDKDNKALIPDILYVAEDGTTYSMNNTE